MAHIEMIRSGERPVSKIKPKRKQKITEVKRHLKIQHYADNTLCMMCREKTDKRKSDILMTWCTCRSQPQEEDFNPQKGMTQPEKSDTQSRLRGQKKRNIPSEGESVNPKKGGASPQIHAQKEGNIPSEGEKGRQQVGDAPPLLHQMPREGEKGHLAQL